MGNAKSHWELVDHYLGYASFIRDKLIQRSNLWIIRSMEEAGAVLMGKIRDLDEIDESLHVFGIGAAEASTRFGLEPHGREIRLACLLPLLQKPREMPQAQIQSHCRRSFVAPPPAVCRGAVTLRMKRF